MLKVSAFALAFLCSTCANAGEPLDLSCKLSTTEFFTPLVQKDLIESRPSEVNDKSINAFHVRPGAQITALGIPVLMVLGYAENPLFFQKKGSPSGEMYAVLVRESIANIDAQLRSIGDFKGKLFRVSSNTTIISCGERK